MGKIEKTLPEKTAELIDISDGIILSDDGKTVTGYKGKRKKSGKTAIRIPSGVEVIEDNAFLLIDFDYLFIPKELRYLGKYTINSPYPWDHSKTFLKKIESIEVEKGNKNYLLDESCLFSLENGKKVLLSLFDKNISVFRAPSDVASFAEGSFDYCPNLKEIILSDGVESFDENSLPNDTNVKEVFISKTVKNLVVKSDVAAVATWNTVSYKIDEENIRLFRDEDSIYEVLDDGSYKLIKCFYKGKGKVLFLENTSIIGANAFRGHNNLPELELPESLRIIESRAFADCTELKSITIRSDLESIADDAFWRCGMLKTVKSECSSTYSFKDGFLKKTATKKQEANSGNSKSTGYDWIKGKIFVHTGLSASEEREFEQIVTSNGGIVKSSTVLATDFLVYNAKYGHETTKLKRALELQDKGKEIKIIDTDKWNALLEGGGKSSEEIKNEPIEISDTPNEKPDKDYFAEFAQKIVKAIFEESISDEYYRSDKATFDEKNRKVIVKRAFFQQNPSAEIVNERVACAETLKVNDPIEVLVKGYSWEAISKKGKSLGEVGSFVAMQAVPYMNFFTIKNAVIADITPKSKRRANSKYAIGSVKFEIVEREISEKMSAEDLITKTQFAYYVDKKEAHIIRWIGDASITTAVIPAKIEGKPVLKIQWNPFGPDMWNEIKNNFDTIIISEGIKELEAGALFNIEGVKKVVFPSSIEHISDDVFAQNDGECRDLYLDRNAVYVAPKGSYAEKFLKAYKPDNYDVTFLSVVNDDTKDSETIQS